MSEEDKITREKKDFLRINKPSNNKHNTKNPLSLEKAKKGRLRIWKNIKEKNLKLMISTTTFSLEFPPFLFFVQTILRFFPSQSA